MALSIAKIKAEKKLLLSTIHNFCISCCGGCRNDVCKCDITECNLHPFRNGNIPAALSQKLKQEKTNAG